MRISISAREQKPLYLYLERVRCPYRHTPRRLKTDLFYKVYQRVFFCTQESLKSVKIGVRSISTSRNRLSNSGCHCCSWLQLSASKGRRVADPYRVNRHKIPHKPRADDILSYTIVSIYNVEIVCLSTAFLRNSQFIAVRILKQSTKNPTQQKNMGRINAL